MSDQQIPSLEALIQTSNDEQPWEIPLPLNEVQVPDFPTGALPEWLANFIRAEAIATQTPEDLCGFLVLAALSASTARKFKVLVRPGYEEPLNLYLVVVLGPAHRKSPVFSHVMKPIQDFEEYKSLEMAPKVREQRALREIKEGQLAAAKRRSSNGVDETGTEAAIAEVIKLTHELSEMPLITLPRLVIDDCTPERLSSFLAEQNERIAVLSAEGGVFEIIGGRYNNNIPNLDVYLKGHSGDDLRVDREKDRENPKFVKSPAITFGLAVQPEVLIGLVSKPGFRGRGLIGRFLFCLPESRMGYRKIAPPCMLPAVYDLYRINVKSLLDLPWNGAANGRMEHHVLHFSPAALERIDFFAQWLEPQLAPFAALGYIADWAGKLVGTVVRIAGNMHLSTMVDSRSPWVEPISAATVENAIRFGEYLIPHAEAAFLKMGADPNIDGAKRILAWLETKSLSTFPKQALWQGTKGFFHNTERLDKALALLEAHNYVRSLKQGARSKPGRKPAPTYEVNPLWRSYKPYSPSNSPTNDDSSISRDSRTDVHGV